MPETVASFMVNIEGVMGVLDRRNTKPAGGEINHQFLNQRSFACILEACHTNDFLLHGEVFNMC
jgi:hypothetical protein